MFAALLQPFNPLFLQSFFPTRIFAALDAKANGKTKVETKEEAEQYKQDSLDYQLCFCRVIFHVILREKDGYEMKQCFAADFNDSLASRSIHAFVKSDVAHECHC